MTESEEHTVQTDGNKAYPGMWNPPSIYYNKYTKWAIYALISLFVIWSVLDLQISLDRFIVGLGAGNKLLSEMLPPTATSRQVDLIVSGLIESFAMANVSTVIGILISLPVAFMASENLAPKPVYYVGRGIISVSRAFHELVIAIIAVVALGFGPLAGVVALVFNTVGFYAKLLAEEIEDMDEGQVEAIRATGASPAQVLIYGVIPQVVHRIVGLSVYRWDINIRKSTIVGIVGAGGIGITLLNAFNRYDYDFGITILLVIVAIVMVGEGVSSYVRGRVN